MTHQPTDLSKAIPISTTQEPWGDRCVYEIPEDLIEKAPYRGNFNDMRECIFQKMVYSVQPHFITRDGKGRAIVNLFFSIGD